MVTVLTSKSMLIKDNEATLHEQMQSTYVVNEVRSLPDLLCESSTLFLIVPSR